MAASLRSSGIGMDTYTLKYPGLQGLLDECRRVYPDQMNPLQVHSLVKSWQGGPDPLDYISMYHNKGNPELKVPEHWHYISFGLSDLHGDGRVFQRNMFGMGKAGFGFELTFRLMKEPDEESPPTWPASFLLQALGRYVFHSGQPLLPGDHISWHKGMNPEDSKSFLRHMLLTTDPELMPVHTPCGSVEFVQIVPITNDELVSVQQWNAASFTQLMRRVPQCGGNFLVTNMSRISIFDIDPALQTVFSEGVEKDGSNLSGAAATLLHWADDTWRFYDASNMYYLKPKYQSLLCELKNFKPTFEHENYRENFKGSNDSLNNYPEFDEAEPRGAACAEGLHNFEEFRRPESVCSVATANSVPSTESDLEAPPTPPPCGYDEATDFALASSLNAAFKSEAGPSEVLAMSLDGPLSELETTGEVPNLNVTYFDQIHITLNLEAGLLLPLALRGRLRHGRHFSFKCATSNAALTLVTSNVDGAHVSLENPFGLCGVWLQVLIEPHLLDAMIHDFDILLQSVDCAYPKTLVWPEWKIAITLIM